MRLTTRRWFGIEIVETGIHFRGLDMHDIRIRKISSQINSALTVAHGHAPFSSNPGFKNGIP